MDYVDISSFHCFLLIAETESFSAAAKRLYLSQSAISQKMSAVEKLLGVKLFIRSKKIELTYEGEVFYTYAKQIIRLHQELVDKFTQPKLQGEIRFGLPEDFATVKLPDILREFILEHPLVSLNVECDLTLNLLQRYKQGEFDIVLVKSTDNKGLKGIDLWQEKLDWVANHDFKYAKDDILPLVLSPEPCVYRARALEALNKKGIKWKVVYSSPSYAGTNAAVKAGMGITVMPHSMIAPGLHKFTSSRLPNLRDVHVYILSRNLKDPAIKSFSDYVIEKI